MLLSVNSLLGEGEIPQDVPFKNLTPDFEKRMLVSNRCLSHCAACDGMVLLQGTSKF